MFILTGLDKMPLNQLEASNNMRFSKIKKYQEELCIGVPFSWNGDIKTYALFL